MSTQHADVLNAVLASLHRSLLQYVEESWPWTSDDDDDLRQAVHELAFDEQTLIARVVDELVRRGAVIDFGTYPTSYTDLQYLSLDFLLREMIRDTERTVDFIDKCRQELANDPEASAPLAEIFAAKQKHLERLRKLVSKPMPSAA